MPVEQLPIFAYYDKQRFLQYSPQDCANFYIVEAPTGKKGKALYPCMGRQHVIDGGRTKLIFSQQPRHIFRSISFVYVVVGSVIYQVDVNLNITQISSDTFTQTNGDLNFAFLPAVQSTAATLQNVFCMFCDGNNTFVYEESNPTAGLQIITDDLRPKFPLYLAAFGNRFVVSSRDSTQFQLTQINMGGTFDANKVFTIPGPTPAVFAQESGLIRQMGVLHQQLYIFTDYTTGVWSNTPSSITTNGADNTLVTTTFPFKKNTSYDFDYGIADPDSLDIDFGMMVWLAQNRNGLVQFAISNGQSVKPISTQAINTLIQQISNNKDASSLLELDTFGFLYQYEDVIFYRASIGQYVDRQTLDRDSFAVSLEYNFDSSSWHRCIELNGQRNIIEQHVFFNGMHLVTAQGQQALYNMSGSIYFNEVMDSTSDTGFTAYPIRYELITPIIAKDDLSLFKTQWVQIDFVWGDMDYIRWNGGFENTVFIIKETGEFVVAEDGTTFVIKEGSDTPPINSEIYTDLYKPHIELFFSDDGGITYISADVREFSQLGVYSWRMRWYQLGVSRNRVYKLICVSPAPIVILGATMMTDGVSGGAI